MSIIKIALQKLVNSQIAHYGRLEIGELDTSKNVVSGNLYLEGEESPIAFSVKYQFVTVEGERSLKISSFKADRVWLTRLAQDHLRNHPLPLKGIWVTLAEMLL